MGHETHTSFVKLKRLNQIFNTQLAETQPNGRYTAVLPMQGVHVDVMQRFR